MSVQANYRYETGIYPLPLHAECIHCHEKLSRKHGAIQTRKDQTQGWFCFGVGPFCYWDFLRVWKDRDFEMRTGHVSNTQFAWNLNGSFDRQALAQANKMYPEVPQVKRDTLE